jgi:hypothetical protein
MLNANDDERQAIVDYLASQASDERVGLLQKVFTERLHDITYDIWDVHTEKERWWVITNPTNLYLQSQFPNMDLALTFHVGLTGTSVAALRLDEQGPDHHHSTPGADIS